MIAKNFLTIFCLVIIVLGSVTGGRSSKRRDEGFVNKKKGSKNGDPHRSVYQARRKPTPPGSAAPRRPNIVLVLTDDQDVSLGSLQFMPRLTKYVREQGAHFHNGFVSTPMCCPSRSSLLTGLYVHNHHVFTNNDNCSSTHWQDTHEHKTFATYLAQAGYSTAYFGKYLNKYSGDHIPPGWGEWAGLVRNSRFYNYSINYNGDVRHHGDTYERDYLPDIITNRSLAFMTQSSLEEPETPFLAVLSYPGPHGPEDSAPQYKDLFFNVTTHHTPAYDFAPNPDKQWILRHTDKMLPVHKQFTDLLMTKRLQTLQSVDSAVEQVYSQLARLGQLDNTYIFYTSDHGYHLGQFGLVKGKASSFDFDTRVPFLVSGPGIAPLSSRQQPVLNIDLAPTFLDIAGLTKPPHMDGKSILPLFAKENKKFRDSFLIERGKMTAQRYEKVKEISNSVDPVPDQNNIATVLRKGLLNKQERLALECRKTRYQAPCTPTQRWVCKEKADGTKKISRCKKGASFPGLDPDTGSPCHCQPGDTFGWAYPKLEAAERKMQKKFLKQHLDTHNLKKLSPKFLRTLPSQTRHHRSVDFPDHNVDQVLLDMAGDEILEVDVTMEDIAATIRSLKNTTQQTEPLDGCTLRPGDQEVVCHNDVTSKKSTWLSNRSTIKHQIQTLRAQLNELKAIRRYLREKRPQAEILNSQIPRKLKNLPVSKSVQVSGGSEVCLCAGPPGAKSSLDVKAERAKRREERKMARLAQMAKKLLKKEKRKARKSSSKADHCKADVKMNCFSHDNNHWKTEPKWTGGPFCACTNSNNNTYWCVRTINSTHNYLYCEYVTGMITFFDMRVDPHQLRNVFQTLTDDEVNYMHGQVRELRNWSGEARYLARKQRQDRERRRQKQLQERLKGRQRKHKQGRGRGGGRVSRFLPPLEYYTQNNARG